MDRLLSIVLTMAAAAIAVSVVHREFFANTSATSPLAPPVLVDNWPHLKGSGIVSGDTGAKVHIVEFADFECPFCARYERVLRAVQNKYEGQVARVFVHLPLDMHRFSRAAARAAECADDQGRFEQIQEALYAKQDSFGLRPWVAYGRDAAVTDISKFDQCVRDTAAVPRIEKGVELARQMQIGGTPTVIVNGWRFVGGPPDSVLSSLIDDLLSGKRPRIAR